MFKFIVVCAFIAAAAGEPEPDAWALSRLSYSGGLILPAPASYPSAYSNVVYSSSPLATAPITYSAPLTHLIKKRSLAYVAPAPLATTYAAAPISTYPAISPYATTYSTYSSFPAPIYTASAHLIKKRSAPLLVPSTYSYPYTASAPLYTPTYAAAASYIPSAIPPFYPLAYSTPFIKK